MSELTVQAKLEHLEKVTEFITHELEIAGINDTDLQFAVTMSLEEVFVNVVSYAYIDSGLFTVHISISDNITVTCEDNGIPFNPLLAKSPDITANADSRPIGGLGIFLVKSLMDSVVYSYENKNILTFSKLIKS